MQASGKYDEPDTSEEPPGANPPKWDLMSWLRELRRSRSERYLGGVAAGIAESWGVPVLLVRLGFILLAFTLIGIPLYVAGWILVPWEGDPPESTRNGRRMLAAAALCTAVLLFGGVRASWFNLSDRFVPLALVLVGVGLLMRNPSRGGAPSGDGAGGEPAHAPIAQTEADQAAGAPTSTVRPPAYSVGRAVPAAPGQEATPPPSGPTMPGPTTPGETTPDPTMPGATMANPPTPKTPRVRPSFAFPFVGLITWSAVLLVLGVLGLLTNGKVLDVGPGVLSAVALLIFSGGLLYSAFRGRARGLILPILVLAAGLGLLSALNLRVDSLDPTFALTATKESQLPGELRATVGESTLDLTRLTLSSDRHLSIRQTAGIVRIALPLDTTVRVNGEIGLGNITLTRPSRQIAAMNNPDTARRWVSDGVPKEGSAVAEETLTTTGIQRLRDIGGSTGENFGVVGKSADFSVDQGSEHSLVLDVSLGVGTIELVDPHWEQDGWKPVQPLQLCTVGGGPAGVVKPCEDVEVTRRVALCINDNGFLVDCREDRPGTAEEPRIAACRDFFGEYIDCDYIGIEPVNAELISPDVEPEGDPEAPRPTIAMPNATSETEGGSEPGATAPTAPPERTTDLSGTTVPADHPTNTVAGETSNDTTSETNGD